MATAKRTTRAVTEEVTVVTLNALEVGTLLDVLAESDNPVLDSLYESLGKPAPRRVRDKDGDVWEESDDGTWIGVTFPADVFGSYRELAERYGPLTDV